MSTSTYQLLRSPSHVHAMTDRADGGLGRLCIPGFQVEANHEGNLSAVTCPRCQILIGRWLGATDTVVFSTAPAARTSQAAPKPSLTERITWAVRVATTTEDGREISSSRLENAGFSNSARVHSAYWAPTGTGGRILAQIGWRGYLRLREDGSTYLALVAR